MDNNITTDHNTNTNNDSYNTESNATTKVSSSDNSNNTDTDTDTINNNNKAKVVFKSKSKLNKSAIRTTSVLQDNNNDNDTTAEQSLDPNEIRELQQLRDTLIQRQASNKLKNKSKSITHNKDKDNNNDSNNNDNNMSSEQFIGSEVDAIKLKHMNEYIDKQLKQKYGDKIVYNNDDNDNTSSENNNTDNNNESIDIKQELYKLPDTILQSTQSANERSDRWLSGIQEVNVDDLTPIQRTYQPYRRRRRNVDQNNINTTNTTNTTFVPRYNRSRYNAYSQNKHADISIDEFQQLQRDYLNSIDNSHEEKDTKRVKR